jgi:drug/metabolite transporter (DMT)-like permease
MIISLMVSLLGMGMYIFTMDFNEGNLAGIGWALANNVFAVVDRLLQRLMLAKDQDPVDMSKTGVTLLNNILGVIPLVFAGLLTGEFSQVPEAFQSMDSVKLFWLISSCFVGAGVSYTGVWVASLISATSFLVLINANKFFIIFLEVVVMKSKELSFWQVIGATTSILAGIAYGKARDALHAAEEEEATDDTESDSDGDTK